MLQISAGIIPVLTICTAAVLFSTVSSGELCLIRAKEASTSGFKITPI